RNPKKTLAQIKSLEKAGCEIVRLAVLDEKAATCLKEIRRGTTMPLVADIHFNHKFALEAINAGFDKIRINPGNIGSVEKVAEVVKAAKAKRIPIRIGVNIGSLEETAERKYGRSPKAMVESAMHEIKILEKLNFKDIVISLKASDVLRTVEAYQMISKRIPYPLHLGITEAGTPNAGIIKSSVGLGRILYDGIGDTVRVSLTADPIEEVRVGWEILKSLGLRKRGVNLISCPTCGRTQIDLIGLANKVEKKLETIDKDITVAVMGCVVNGPGEAKEADLGVAGGKNAGILFKKGKILKTLPEDKLLSALFQEIKKL
ncbi:flavodoxin-dependent (E)-4-hydroxy-3-methylbut-2-enyl-diphosphate synthase, partial [bacterium]|nr:flavodoxin-dependent (E)-4-hydroxy-3-methylbut-2-enyl-diphosphate synthase [bacterium]